jgi:flagellar hook-associated protein 3 FlgL
MRVSTSMIFNSGTSGIQNRQSDLYRVQNQMSTGRRILTPEDDPIGASEALLVTQSKGVNTQYLDNQANAQTQLGFLESTLGSITDEFLRIGELVAMANNQTAGASVAPELKGRLENLIGLANTQDGTGKYIFSGYQSNTKPFDVTGGVPPAGGFSLNGTTYVSYMGDSGKPSLQVSASQNMAVSENGLDVFMQIRNSAGAVTGRSLFDSLKNMLSTIDGTVPYSAATQAQVTADVSSALSHISGVRASVGARQNSLEGLTTSGVDVATLYDSRLSALQDLDYTAAISEFANYKMQLEAAQLSFKQSSQLSLFNIL